MRVSWFALATLLVGGVVQGCDSTTACGDHVTTSTVPTAPVIENAALLTQLPQDTWTVVLGLDFSDVDGDLAPGKLWFYLNDSASTGTSQPLLAAFHQSALADDATAGRLTVPLRFDDSIRDGTDVHLGVHLVDDAQHRSNCYGLALSFEVTPR